MKHGLQLLLTIAVAVTAGCQSGEQPTAKPTETAVAQPPVTNPEPAADKLGAAVRAALDSDMDAHYFDARTDLNGDGKAEVITYVTGPMACGTGGCPLFVFADGPEGYRLVSAISVVQVPVRLSPRSTEGWRNLVVGIGGGGIPSGNAELMFDGKTYPENPTVAPAKPVNDLTDSEVLIAEFASFKDGKPVPAKIYGDPTLPVAGQALDVTIHTQDAEELRYYVLRELTGRFAAEKELSATENEQTAYIKHMRDVLSKDSNFTASPQSAEDDAARKEIAAAFILQWKINRALHAQYGGRIIFQQAGPEPLDAYRKFLEEHAARGDFRIANKDLETGFWRYYRDDTIHDFLKPGSAEEAKAFADPPWLTD